MTRIIPAVSLRPGDVCMDGATVVQSSAIVRKVEGEYRIMHMCVLTDDGSHDHLPADSFVPIAHVEPLLYEPSLS